MSDVVSALPAGFRLPGFGFVNAEGPDALAFLQSQLSSDLRPLADGDAQWSALLNPQGRAIACLAVFRVSATQFRLLLPLHAIDSTISHLRRFQLRSKLTLTAEPVSPAGGWLDATPAPAGSLRTATRWFGVDETASLETDADGLARWALADIDEGIIWLSADQQEQFVAQMLGLEQLGALSLRKGCYPGQEIVARAHYRGSVKRRAARLCLDAPVGAGDRVERAVDGSECGVVLSSASLGEIHRAIAILSVEPDSSTFLIRHDGQLTARAERC